jgi:hypothetical protein
MKKLLILALLINACGLMAHGEAPTTPPPGQYPVLLYLPGTLMPAGGFTQEGLYQSDE